MVEPGFALAPETLSDPTFSEQECDGADQGVGGPGRGHCSGKGGKVVGGPGNWSPLVCLELGASEGKGSERGGWTGMAWTARGSVLMGATLGFWTPVLHPKGL